MHATLKQELEQFNLTAITEAQVDFILCMIPIYKEKIGANIRMLREEREKSDWIAASGLTRLIEQFERQLQDADALADTLIGEE